MDKEITYKEFCEIVSYWWSQEDYTYGSVQFAAKRAVRELTLKGITNAQEMYDKYRIEKGDQFYYAGD
jgi:hypothetical protein